jgi:nitrite reductase/ring-hydroxylating ferredoxin subunit
VLIRVCAVADIGREECRRIEVRGRPPVAVFLVGDALFATDDTCTHGDASLCEGFLEGEEIECPFHSGRFNVVTGAAVQFPATEALATHDIVTEGDTVYVSIKEK